MSNTKLSKYYIKTLYRKCYMAEIYSLWVVITNVGFGADFLKFGFCWERMSSDDVKAFEDNKAVTLFSSMSII